MPHRIATKHRAAAVLSTVVVLAVAGVGACRVSSDQKGGTGGSPSGGSGGAEAASGGAAGIDAAVPGSGGASGAPATGGSGSGSGGASGAGGAGGRGDGRGGGAGDESGGSGGGDSGRGGSGRGGSGGAGARATGGSDALDCAGAAYDPARPPMALTLSGNLAVHDPAAIVVGNTIYLAATGLVAKTSVNLTTWQPGGTPLNPLPAWVAQQVPGATNLWAPDLSAFGGLYHMYYAASTFGSNKSCIGHATRVAMDTGAWADQGTVLCSNMGTTDDWNAIDPNVVLDDAGTPWLALGSFWGGLKMIKLTPTGARADTTLYSIAARPGAGGALEGAWVFKRCGYYYLFSSWGSCCSDAYDYNIRVGRSSTVTGPYADKAGVALMQGGGTLLVTGNGTWKAPGHNAVIAYGGKTYNVYHALTAQDLSATLRISELVWDSDGWPVSGGP